MKPAKMAAFALAIAMLISSGCITAAVNPEKDKETVVLTIGGDQFRKKDFLRFYETSSFLSEASGQGVPTSEQELTTYKKDAFKNFRLFQIAKKEVDSQAEKPTLDEEAIKSNLEDAMKAAKEAFPEDGGYEALVSRYATDENDIKTKITEALTLQEYYNAFGKLENTDLSKDGDETVATVDGVKIPRSTMYYYVIYYSLVAYANNQQPSDTASLFKQSLMAAARDQAYSDYAKKNNFDITEEQVKAALTDSIDIVEAMFGEETLNSFLRAYYINTAQHEAARNLIGTSIVAQNRVEDEEAQKINPTDEELEAYYKENIKHYSNISVKHILTKDKNEELAKQILAEVNAQPDKAKAFDEAIEKYKDDERIQEASDLGEIDETGSSPSGGTMVEDFTKGAFEINEGEAKIVETADYGFHVVFVYKKNTAPATVDPVKGEVRTSYIEEKVSTPLQSRLEEIYNKANKKETSKYTETPQETFDKVMKRKYSIKENEAAAIR